MKTLSKLMLSIVVISLSTMRLHAMGWVPPPSAPQGFYVIVQQNAVVAYWQSSGTVWNAILTIDGATAGSGTDNNGTLTVNKSLDLTKAHHFTLIFNNFLGNSPAAVYDYTPPPSTTVIPYEFTNISTTGPVVQAYMTFTTNTQNTSSLTTVNLNSLSSSRGTVTLPKTGSQYIVSAKGTLIYGTVNGPEIDCGTLTVNADSNNQWPQGKTVVATYHDSLNPSKFGCTVSLQ